MKILGETETLKMDRKLLKPQVERRRRERMNRSLENLRTLLLQGPEHNSQRRLEKAEILEYTVLFLQNSVGQDKQAKDGEEEKHRFMDGFSSCLQKASRFLLDEGQTRGLEGSVTATLCQRLSQPNIRLPVRIHSSSSRIQVPVSKVHQAQQQNSTSKQELPSSRNSVVPNPHSVPFRSSDSNTHHSTSRPSPHHQAPVNQTVWRPWP